MTRIVIHLLMALDVVGCFLFVNCDCDVFRIKRILFTSSSA